MSYPPGQKCPHNNKTNNKTNNKSNNNPYSPLNEIKSDICNFDDKLFDEQLEEIQQDYEEKFNKFWEAYPRHDNKKKALAWFKKNKPNDELLKTMLDKIEEFKKTKQWQNSQYIPMPTTWLNGERWEDDIPDGDKVLSLEEQIAKEEEEEREFCRLVQASIDEEKRAGRW